MDIEPRIKTGNKGEKPPYPLNQLTRPVVLSIAKDLLIAKYVRNLNDVAGSDWESIFARSIGAKWSPSNFGLDDVVKANCCWGAKTVKATRPKTQVSVRLISGRNSPNFSYGESNLHGDPDKMGKMILGIWNARVDGVVVRHAFARTVVLIKGPQLLDFAIFETELKRFDPSLFHWERNSRGNLVGRDANEIHRFTWQPSGSQFTIIEKIPLNRHYVKFDVPEELIVQDNDAMLDSLGFTEDWIILDREN